MDDKRGPTQRKGEMMDIIRLQPSLGTPLGPDIRIMHSQDFKAHPFSCFERPIIGAWSKYRNCFGVGCRISGVLGHG